MEANNQVSSSVMTSKQSSSNFASTLGLMSQAQVQNDKDPSSESVCKTSDPAARAELDPEYLSHIESVVSKTGFTSPQQIYETISSMSTDDSVHCQPSVYNLPPNPTIPPLNTAASAPASANQLESFLSIPVLPSSRDRGRRVELTLQEKVDLIQHSKGKSQRALAEIFGVGKSQVNLILKRKNEIINMYAKGGHLDRKRLRLRADKDEINSLTLEWFMKEQKSGTMLTGPMVQEKAKEFAVELGRTEFRASNGWFHSFCKRNNIGFNSKQGLYLKEMVNDSTWPSQVMGGTESWTEDSCYDLGQEELEEENAVQSDMSDDKSNQKLENYKKKLKSDQVQESDNRSQEPVMSTEACSTSTDRTPPPGKKFKRCELNLLEKVELLHQHSSGKPEKELSKMFGVGRSQVYSTLKRRAEILEAYERLGNTNRKRLHSRAESDEVNQLTWHWFKEIAKMNSVQISGPMLQAKAKEFANQLGRDDFKASNGWLDTFRKRHYIKFTTGQGFVYDPPENIPLESFFPPEQDEPVNKKAKSGRKKQDKVNKRVDLTIQEKVELIQQSEGKSQRQLATLFGVGKSQVHSILRRKEEILEAFNTSGKGSMKRMNNRAETDDVNRLTWQWFREVSLSSDAQLTGVMVQAKAREIAKQLGRDDFKASNGWLDSFRKRNNIVTNDQKHLVICDEKDILAWKDSLADYTKGYDARNIYCVSELPLFYTSMPEPVTDAAKYQIKKKFQMQSVSVVLCSNILGEFQTPVVIGKQTPERSRLKIPSDLPVCWRWSSSTWSTVEFFTDWVASLDQKMGQQDRKIVLFVDRAPPDATEILLEHVQLVCPPTHSSRLQPLSHGVLECFKQKYLRQMLSALVKQTASLNENISKVLSHVSVLDACTWISQAVRSIDPTVITKAFCDCGFNFGYTPVDTPDPVQDEEYEALIKRVIDSFARKPLSYYMGIQSEEASSTDSKNIDCSQLSYEGDADVQSVNEEDSDNPEDVSSSSSNPDTDESGEEEEEDRDPSISFSLDKFSPLGQSLYKSSRRATMEKNQRESAVGVTACSDCQVHTATKLEDEPENGQDDDQSDDSDSDKLDIGDYTSVSQKVDIPVLRSREEALSAAESLRQYCVEKNLLHVVDSINTVIKVLYG